MPTITLLEKVHGTFSQQLFQAKLVSLCRDLTVEAEVIGKTSRGWVQVELTGEDQKVTMEFLDREIGVAPVSIDKVKKFLTIKGKVIFAGEKEQELLVDIGVYSPRVYDATIPLERLQAQLADGKKLPLRRLIELFCLRDHMPLNVTITREVKLEHEQVEAELSEAQLSKFIRWVNSSLDRLVVLGATLSQVKHAINVSGHNRDIVRVEILGLLEHAVVCKLGTDAVGLTPKLGPHLYTATLAPLAPEKYRKQSIDLHDLYVAKEEILSDNSAMAYLLVRVNAYDVVFGDLWTLSLWSIRRVYVNSANGSFESYLEIAASGIIV